jgi:hypothetical protein
MIPEGYTPQRDGSIIGPRGKPRKLCLVKGYYGFTAWWEGKVKTFLVHQVVCEAFHGAKPTAEHEVRHIDGDQLNNHATNLCWGTKAENAADRARHGTLLRGERHPISKLTEQQVREIRTRYAAGESQVKLGPVYGVDRTTIRSVVNRKNWKHI